MKTHFATCVECGKSFPVPPCRVYKARYCSGTCRGVASRRTKPCETCGKPINARKRFCSHVCTGKSKERRVQWVCRICGTRRMKIPSYNATACKDCDLREKLSTPAFVQKANAAMHTPEARDRSSLSSVERNKTDKLNGKFATNRAAREWHLRSPQGETFRFRNLRHFIREHRCLFSERELSPIGRVKGIRAESRTLIEGALQKLSPRVKIAQTTAHGWTRVLYSGEPDPRLVTGIKDEIT